MKEYDSLEERIQKRKEYYITQLQRLVRQPSVSAKNEGIRDCALLLKEIMEEHGITTRLLEIPNANPVVYGEVRVRGSSKTLLFYNHYDVQPAEPVELWRYPPFSATLIDGRIYGRGAADDKGEILSRLAAVDAYLASGKDPPCSFKFVIEGEEEIGSINLPRYAEKYRDLFQADSGIWEFGGIDNRGRPIVSLGMKGILYVELLAKGPARDLHSSLSAIVENPAWRLVRAISSFKDHKDNISIKGWNDRIRKLTEDEKRLLDTFPYDEEEVKKSYGIASFINDLSGYALKEKLYTQPTCNICGIWSGYQGPGSKTVLPSEAHAKLDFRLVPDQDPEELSLLLRKHLDENGFSDVQIVYKEGEPAARISHKERIAIAAAKAGKKAYGVESILSVSSAGTGPMYIFSKELAVPCVGIGTGHPDDAQHSPNESKRIDTFVNGTKWVAYTIQEFASSS